MRFRLTVGLPDRPGSLLKVLEQIATHGGNIISIIHNRDNITGGYVPVNIQVDFPDQESVERSKAAIESVGIPVLGSETLEKKVETLLVVGVDDVEGVISHLNSLAIKVIGMSLSGLPSNPCLKIVVELPLPGRRELLEKLSERIEWSGGLLIREMEE